MKYQKSFNLKTASALAWVFPGMGHYYSGRVRKGVLFTGLELFSIAAILGISNDYNRADKEYLIAKGNMDGIGETTNCENHGSLGDCYTYWKSEAQMQLESRNTDQVSRIVAGTAAAGIWLWNIRDVKKNKLSAYSNENKFSVGVNRYGQVEARIRF